VRITDILKEIAGQFPFKYLPIVGQKSRNVCVNYRHTGTERNCWPITFIVTYCWTHPRKSVPIIDILEMKEISGQLLSNS
jgi:hypothetical protein